MYFEKASHHERVMERSRQNIARNRKGPPQVSGYDVLIPNPTS
jgi:hypothetical protein